MEAFKFKVDFKFNRDTAPFPFIEGGEGEVKEASERLDREERIKLVSGRRRSVSMEG